MLFHDDFDVLAAEGAFDTGPGSLLEMLGRGGSESARKKKKGKEGRHAKAVQGVGRQKESASERAQERHKEGPRVAKGGGARLDGPAVASQVKRALEGGVGQGGRKKEKKAKAGRLS